MRRGLPVVVGALAAALAFAVVMVVSDDDDAPRARAGAPAPVTVSAAQSGGLAVFARMGCGGCHRLAAAGSTGEIGPSLDAVLASHTERSLKVKIANPTPGTAMPADFEERMSATELDALVSFLLRSGR
jgi:mono/diheme cytochrome c family protein